MKVTAAPLRRFVFLLSRGIAGPYHLHGAAATFVGTKNTLMEASDREGSQSGGSSGVRGRRTSGPIVRNTGVPVGVDNGSTPALDVRLS